MSFSKTDLNYLNMVLLEYYEANKGWVEDKELDKFTRVNEIVNKKLEEI